MAATFKDYLRAPDCFDLSAELAEALIACGMDSLDAVKMQPVTSIQTLSKTISGLNLGLILPLPVTHNLVMLRYFLHHQDRISDTISIQEMQVKGTMEALQKLYELKEMEDDFKLKKAKLPPPKFTSVDKFRYTLEEIRNFCKESRGIDGTLLSYVIRSNIEPTPYPEPNLWSTDETMVNRHPLRGAKYNHDNKTVWALVNAIFHGTDGWAWVQGFTARSDGRGAVTALEMHYLDDTMQDTLFTQAFAVINQTQYRGETKNFTFEKFASKLKTAHQDMEAVGHPMDEYIKIKMLELNCVDPKLDIYKVNMRSRKDEFNTFEKCINFLKHKVYEGLTPTRTIGEVNHASASPPNKRRKSGQSNNNKYQKSNSTNNYVKKRDELNRNFRAEDRYYPRAVFRMLNQANRKLLMDRRPSQNNTRNIHAVSSEGNQNEADLNVGVSNINLGNTMTRRSGLQN